VSARPFTARDARECRRRRGWRGNVRLMGPIRRQAAVAKSVTVGRAGEGPDWRGFCAAVTPRFSASSPELAGGGRRQPAIRMFSERWQRTRLARSGQRNRFFFCLFLPAGGSGCGLLFLPPGRGESHDEPGGTRPQCPDSRSDWQQS